MSTYRIRLIAAFCAIAAFTGSTAARADHHKPHANAKADSSVTAGASSHHLSDKDKGAADHMSANSEIHRASDHANARKLGELKGKKVMGSDGEKLGDLHDFVLDAKSGQIAHAVVSTGGLLGVGDKLRVVARDSLEHDGDHLSVQMDKSAFEALPTVEEKDLEAGKLTAKANNSKPDWQSAGASTSRQSSATADADATANASSSATGITDPDATDNSASAGATIGSSTAANDAASINAPADTSTAVEPTPSVSSSGSVAATTTQPADVSGVSSASSEAGASMPASGNFILASELDGKELRAGGEEIGTIEGVAIDLEQGTAMAVVKIKSDTAGGDDLFHVPFGSLQIDSAHSQSVSTTLARTDFTQAMSASEVAVTTPGGVSNSDDSLPPTGRTSPSTGTYGSATNSSTTVSQANDPAAVASETTEPYGATADSSRASSTGITGSTAASAPGGAMVTNPGYSSPASSTTGNIPSVETNTSADSRSDAKVNRSTDTSSSSVAGPGTTEPLTAEDEQLTPTGRDHGSDLTSAAAAIRSALNSDQTLASEDVKVQEAGKKIMLQGKVSSEDARERIETLAKQAAGSAEIESKLKVKDQE